MKGTIHSTATSGNFCFQRKKSWFKCLHLNKKIPTKVAYKTCPFLAYRSCQKAAPQVKAFQYLRFTVKKLRNDTTAEGVWEFFDKKGVVGQGSQPPSKKAIIPIKGKDRLPVFLSEVCCCCSPCFVSVSSMVNFQKLRFSGICLKEA